jgi:predicted class III extradiol MEMO1 family dioxygenase
LELRFERKRRRRQPDDSSIGDLAEHSIQFSLPLLTDLASD